MNGILYGVSVGAGDPELLTLKAVRIINSCDVIAVPRTKGENTLALDIVRQSCDVERKEILYLDFLMSRDKKLLEDRHNEIAEQLIPFLKDGKNIAFLSIGDISIYSTFSYIAEIIQSYGIDVEICAGVPSFCLIAAETKRPLVQGKEPLIVIPYSCKEFDTLIKSSGTKVIMKGGKNISAIKEKVTGNNAYAVCSCGLPDEKIYQSLEDMPDNCGYFTTIIVESQG